MRKELDFGLEEVKRESQVSRELNLLSNTIDELDSVFGNIISRVGPVRYSSVEPIREDEKKEILPSLCEIADRIRTIRLNLTEIIYRMIVVKDEIEL